MSYDNYEVGIPNEHRRSYEIGQSATGPAPVKNLSRADFRLCLETALDEREGNFRHRFRLRRAINNRRVFDRLYAEVTPKIQADPDRGIEGILDWFLNNWEEILKILLTILPLFI